jgi:hypothetical protein
MYSSRLNVETYNKGNGPHLGHGRTNTNATLTVFRDWTYPGPKTDQRKPIDSLLQSRSRTAAQRRVCMYRRAIAVVHREETSHPYGPGFSDFEDL